jgi:hypothetical protein
MALLDEFYAWRLAVRPDCRTLEAKQAEAFLVLENELRSETCDERS